MSLDEAGRLRALAGVRRRTRLVAGVRRAGPGVISAASDNDPTTIASLAVIGSTTRYALCWLVVVLVPMLVVVQSISARVGVVARRGLEDVVRARYGRFAALATLVLVLSVNVVTLGADVEGGAAAIGLLVHADARLFVVPLTLAVAALLAGGRYDRVERVLKVVLLGFVVYVVAAFLARPAWGSVLSHTFAPRLSLSSDYVDGALALLGTTLTSYAYFWESISTARSRPPLRRLGSAQLEAGAGMVGAGVLFFFIVVTTGATLGAHHRAVQTATDAADALRPLAGSAASVLFGVGLLAAALLALPVLAGTTAYVLAEALGWKGDLDDGFGDARGFYVSMLLALAAGAAIALSGVSAITLLFDSSLVAGLATPVTLALMMRAAGDRRVMGEHRVRGAYAWAGWAVVAVVAVACALFLVRAATGG